MKITEDHKRLQLGSIDEIFWDSVFDSTANKEPTVENVEKTNRNLSFSNVLDEASEN